MSEFIVETSAANWKKQVLESKELVIVEFWHPQCSYCRMLEPVYHELAQEYREKLKFVKFNVMENQANQELALKYGIMGTPTLKFFCQGRPVQDIVGVLRKDDLKKTIEFAINKYRECAEKSTPLNLSYIS
jgi:thioredoxin 1